MQRTNGVHFVYTDIQKQHFLTSVVVVVFCVVFVITGACSVLLAAAENTGI